MERKKLAVLGTLIILTLAFCINSAQARIDSHRWTNPKQRGYYDSYYDNQYVSVAYDRGSTAKLIVVIANNRGDDYYYVVRVKMDWAVENATSEIVRIKRGEIYVFELNIPIPSNASNLYMHSYTIYSEYKYAPGDPWRFDEARTFDSFVVYSPEQSEAISLKRQLDAYPSWYPTPFINSAKARELLVNASILESLGDQAYQAGNFESARNYYRQALENTMKAYTSDTQYLSSLETALLGLMSAGQNYLSFQGIAFIIASVGFLLMGIGVVVYLVRRSKPPKAAQTN